MTIESGVYVSATTVSIIIDVSCMFIFESRQLKDWVGKYRLT